MKAYVIPVGRSCNANCEYCITRFRQNYGDLIDAEKISRHLSEISNLDFIEITGGGEPLIHPKINQIIKICSGFAPTRLYSNGAMLKGGQNVNDLSELCISRAHFESNKNFEIMGVKYSDQVFGLHKNIKLSLMLLKNVINNFQEILEYLNWANSLNVKKVVIRELGNDPNKNYQKIFKKFFLPVSGQIPRFSKFRKAVKSKNPTYFYKKLIVELELIGCPELGENIILRSDNKFYSNWN